MAATVNGIAIGVDVMAGFPSEGEDKFKNTLHLLQDLPVAYLHVFSYSERPGTLTQKIQPKVPEALKKDHAAILRNLGIKKREEFALRFLSKKLNVLGEKAKDKKAALMKGFSQNYMQVRLEENNYSIVNNIVIVTVQAVKFRDGKLYEKIVSG